MNIPTPQTEDTRTKHEILLLILHHLEEEGMAQSAQTLRDEISAQRRGATVGLTHANRNRARTNETSKYIFHTARTTF